MHGELLGPLVCASAALLFGRASGRLGAGNLGHRLALAPSSARPSAKLRAGHGQRLGLAALRQTVVARMLLCGAQLGQLRVVLVRLLLLRIDCGQYVVLVLHGCLVLVELRVVQLEQRRRIGAQSVCGAQLAGGLGVLGVGVRVAGQVGGAGDLVAGGARAGGARRGGRGAGGGRAGGLLGAQTLARTELGLLLVLGMLQVLLLALVLVLVVRRFQLDELASGRVLVQGRVLRREQVGQVVRGGVWVRVVVHGARGTVLLQVGRRTQA